MSQVFTLSIGKTVKIDANMRAILMVTWLPTFLKMMPTTGISLMTIYTNSLEKDVVAQMPC